MLCLQLLGFQLAVLHFIMLVECIRDHRHLLERQLLSPDREQVEVISISVKAQLESGPDRIVSKPLLIVRLSQIGIDFRNDWQAAWYLSKQFQKP